MRKIVLLYNDGLSTGILVEKMKASADATSCDCEISAAPVADAEVVRVETDIIPLGPQVRFQMEVVRKQVSCPAVSVNPTAYGAMNGKEVLNQAREEMDD